MQYDYLDNRYQQLTILGREEKKTTYLARDQVSGRIVVKKYIQMESAEIYECISKLKSPQFVQIFHVAKKEKVALVIMEYVSGRTIEEWLKELGVFSEKMAVYYIEQLLRGMIEIHGQGIIHRDINPKNVLISTDGVVKLLDFDIGRQFKASQGSDTMILGTVGYAAPEQFGFTQSDKRTDIYAIGVLMNVMLTGCLPKDKLYTNGRLGHIIRTCTQIDPDKRYQHIEEIQQQIQLLKGGEPYDEIREVNETEEMVSSVKIDHSIWPGFRTGKLWKKLIATVYYAFMGIYSVVTVGEYAKTPLAGGLEFVAIIMYLWLSVLLPLNFLHWMDKTPGVRKLETYGRVVLGILLWLVLIYYGIKLENYVRIDLLHIATKS